MNKGSLNVSQAVTPWDLHRRSSVNPLGTAYGILVGDGERRLREVLGGGAAMNTGRFLWEPA